LAEILIVDDDSTAMELFAAILRQNGFSVLTASSAFESLSILSALDFDVVLSDLRLPDMSGLDMLKQLRDRGSMVPFVLLTGFGSIPDVVAAMRLGAFDFLEKPITNDDLVQTVRSVLERHGSDSRTLTGGSTPEAYAAARWARAVSEILVSPGDPRTIGAWGRLIGASSGALRTWCRTAGMSPRRSLVFGRLLRVVCLSGGTHDKLENLLDIVDRRTVVGLLKLAGLCEVPDRIDDYLDRQVLVRDTDMLSALKRRLEYRDQQIPPSRAGDRHSTLGREDYKKV